MDLVQRVHEGVAAALAHADVPQMQVVAELARRQQLLAFNAIPYQVITLYYGHVAYSVGQETAAACLQCHPLAVNYTVLRSC